MATTGELESYRRSAGAIASTETTTAPTRGRYHVNRVKLVSTSGLTATGWLLRPGSGAGCHPAVLLQDGREENSGVIFRLPPDFGDLVVLSLDYPEGVPATLRLGDVTRQAGRIRRSMEQIPALFSIGAAYLAGRADVDSTRIAMAATSFAVPFASIAAAADPRFREVALIYGAGDLPTVLAANLELRVHAFRRPVAWLASRPFVALSPERFIGLVAPRPVVMVNGIDDASMPNDAVQRLYDAARAPKSITWLRTGHVSPTDSGLIRTLVDSAFAKLTVLHAPAESRRCTPNASVGVRPQSEPTGRVVNPR